ncbi:MAG: LysR substrate-binding domain-containing protein [Gammaproteobacteria bacterium]|jgi:LysR family hydrogen peroxide-inducible transcriptional activator
MTLTELRYIVAVAKEKQFCKAAKSCFVSQPTLSLGIKKLEEELGVVLFERKHQELVITPIGQKIVSQAEQALKEVKIIREIAQLERNPLSEPLRLGAIHTVGPYLFPDLLPVVQENVPQLPLLVEESYTHELTKKLKNGDIDAAVISLPYNEPGIDTEILYEEPFVILVPSSHPMAMADTISIKQLAKETVLLLGPQHCFRDQVMALCPDCFQSTPASEGGHNIEGSSLETIRFMVAGGVGVAIVPRMAACADRYAQRLICIKHFSHMEPTRKVAIAWRKNFTRTQAIETLAQCIRDCSLAGAKIHRSKSVHTTATPSIASASLQ